VTFRLRDSIPQTVMLQWQDLDRVWLAAHGIGGSLAEPRWQCVYDKLPANTRRGFERRAARRLHVALDEGHGACMLRNSEIRAVVTNALKHFHGERWWVGDFVVMPNHVHGLWQPIDGFALEDVLASVKGFASRQLTKRGIKSGQLWQEENYDRLVRDRLELHAWREYIQRNPLKAELGETECSCHRSEWLDEKQGAPLE
jgi:type I restriction enzyme R subunit